METYNPSLDDKQRLKKHIDMFKVSGDKVFATLQGEGVTSGKPAVFLRLHFCNLSCGLNAGWKCDTGYTWDIRREEFWKEPVDWNYEKTAEEIKNAWQEKFGDIFSNNDKRVVITGGEPLLQQKKILKLRKMLSEYKFEIETNGTIVPFEDLKDCQFNCSPKLSNSGNQLSKRINIIALQKINAFSNSWFKFVVEKPEDCNEIEELINIVGLKQEKILIMPEGHDKKSLNKHFNSVKEQVEKHNWTFAKRNQIEWFGNKRRT